MTREEQIKVLKDWKPELELMAKYNSNSIDYQRYTALEMVIKALEQEPCEDWYDVPSNEMTLEQARQAVKDLRNLRKRFKEDLEQEPKTGHWMLKRTFPTNLYDENLNEYKCSECYREIRCTESQLVNYPYCHCGAKMIEPQESEDKR